MTRRSYIPGLVEDVVTTIDAIIDPLNWISLAVAHWQRLAFAALWFGAIAASVLLS